MARERRLSRADTPFRRRNRHGNSPVAGRRHRSGIARTTSESIVNEFLIVRPLACFAGIEREMSDRSKGDVSSGTVMTGW